MNTPHCVLAPEDLVAYQDGDLDAVRRAEVELHVAQCPVCREYIEISQDVARIFERTWPLEENPAGQARTIARIHELHARQFHEPWWRRKALALVTAVLVLILTLIVLWPSSLEATASSLSSLLHYTEQRVTGTVLHRDDLPGEPAEGIPREPVFVAPTQLPLELELVGTEKREGERLSLQYEDGDHLTILLDQAPSDDAADSVSVETAQVARVKETDVLWLRGPRRGTVSVMLWERHEVVFSIMVLEAPPPPDAGLELKDAMMVVESVMEQQES